MKYLASILLILVVTGSYEVGKMHSDLCWKSIVENEKQLVRDEIIYREIEVTRALYDWNRPIRIGLYVGCTDLRPLKVNGLVLRDLDYGMWLDCSGGKVDFSGGMIELGSDQVGIMVKGTQEIVGADVRANGEAQ